MLIELVFGWRAGSVPKASAINCRGMEIIPLLRVLRVLIPPLRLLLQMESLGSSSSVSNPQMEADPVEVEVDDVDLERMSKDLLRIHVRLIMEGVLTMEESKPVLHRAFGALRRLGHDGVSVTLSHDCDRLESLLAR